MMSEKGGEFPPQEQSKPVEQSVEREIGNRELPIWEKMPEVVETLRNNNRLILVSETGSGKTTQVPQALWAESCYVNQLEQG